MYTLINGKELLSTRFDRDLVAAQIHPATQKISAHYSSIQQIYRYLDSWHYGGTSQVRQPATRLPLSSYVGLSVKLLGVSICSKNIVTIKYTCGATPDWKRGTRRTEVKPYVISSRRPAKMIKTSPSPPRPSQPDHSQQSHCSRPCQVLRCVVPRRELAGASSKSPARPADWNLILEAYPSRICSIFGAPSIERHA